MLKKILEVYTKEYKRETRYRKLMERNLQRFKLNDDSEDVNIKVKRISDKKF